MGLSADKEFSCSSTPDFFGPGLMFFPVTYAILFTMYPIPVVPLLMPSCKEPLESERQCHGKVTQQIKVLSLQAWQTEFHTQNSQYKRINFKSNFIISACRPWHKGITVHSYLLRKQWWEIKTELKRHVEVYLREKPPKYTHRHRHIHRHF